MTAPTHHADVVVLGAGSAAETLVRELSDSGRTVVVFEPGRVGGECPFVACMPSKSMLHDARAGVDWDVAVERRMEITEQLDDSGHADDLVANGAELVRAHATIVDANTVVGGGQRVSADHIVIATGATPVLPPIMDRATGTEARATGGEQDAHPAIWTSDDALTARRRPERLVVAGGGVIGIECAVMFARFGTDVTLIDNADRSMPDAPPRVSEILRELLDDAGVDVRRSVEVEAIAPRHNGAVVRLSDGSEVSGDRVLVAIGRRPNTGGLGLESLGLDGDEPLPIEASGRVRVDGSVWAIGDVAGVGEYTHLANHHARVVADHLIGSAERTFDDVVLASCMFTDPPFVQVGAAWADLHDDPDIVSAGLDLETFPRAMTDGLAHGHLWVAARKSTGRLVAATGIGPAFDELVHALVVAIDGDVPVSRLRQSMQPFPTIGEILGALFDELHNSLAAR